MTLPGALSEASHEEKASLIADALQTSFLRQPVRQAGIRPAPDGERTGLLLPQGVNRRRAEQIRARVPGEAKASSSKPIRC